MNLAGGFAEQLDALGVWWPRGDGDALRDAARAWTDIADVLSEITTALDHSQEMVAETYEGPAAASLRELWTEWSGEGGHLPDTVADCRRLAAALRDFGGDIDAAQSTLLRLVDEVLETGGGHLDVHGVEHLRHGADEIGDALSARAAVRCDPLGAIGTVRPRLPLDRATIDAEAVSWIDPGDPDDLGFLVGQSVDFGAGEGAIAYLLPGLVGGHGPNDGAGDDGPGGSPVPSGPLDPCPTATDPSDACSDDDALDPGLSPDGAGDDRLPTDGEPISLQPPPADAIDDPLDDPLGLAALGGAGGGIGGGGGGSSGGFGGGLGGGGFDGFDLDAALDTVPDAALGAVPVAVGAAAIPAASRLLGPTSTVPPTPLAPTTPTTASSSGGSRMPFMPMMPMMGGSGGEDGAEPKRRRTRTPRWSDTDA